MSTSKIDFSEASINRTGGIMLTIKIGCSNIYEADKIKRKLLRVINER